MENTGDRARIRRLERLVDFLWVQLRSQLTTKPEQRHDAMTLATQVAGDAEDFAEETRGK